MAKRSRSRIRRIRTSSDLGDEVVKKSFRPIVLTSRQTENFWAKVIIPSNKNVDCWLWTASVYSNGYGCFTVKKKPEKYNLLPHRIAYTLKVGPIPAGMELMHSCDNRVCVNPKHLKPCTHAENMADVFAKGRNQRGSSHYASKLTEDQVREIRRAQSTGVQQKVLAARFGISFQGVSRIVLRDTWKHVL